MRKRPLMLLACVFLIGLTCQRFSAYGLAGVVVFMVLRECRIGRKRKKNIKMAGRSMLLLSAFFIGIFHMQKETEFRDAYMSKIVDGSRITVWGKCIKTETTEYGFRGILSDCYIRMEDGQLPCNDIMVYTSEDHFKIGQIHKIEGKVKLFAKARNEGNFDACAYYQSMKIDFAVEEEKFTLLENNNSLWSRWLLSLKEKVNSVYENHMEEKAIGFYQAMVTGTKNNLDEGLKELFLFGGISHILAISGLHVSLLGRSVYRVLRRGCIGFGLSGVIGGLLLVFYCMMVGSGISTIRAVGMLLLLFLAQWMGRSYDMLNALGGMVLLLLLVNPFLIENTGFWFSVTALLGVGSVGLTLSKLPSQLEGEEEKQEKAEKGKLWYQKIKFSGLWMSLGITLTTLPVTALSYYEIPLYSPLVNVMILPMLAPVFGLAVVGGLLGVIFPNIGFVRFLFQPCQWALHFFEWVCTIVSQLPGAALLCGKPDWWQIGVYYIVLFGGVYMIRHMDDFGKMASLWKKDIEIIQARRMVVGVILVCCSLCILFPKPKNFEITFLDVGQGDGIYMSAGDGSTYFIDGGSSDVEGVGIYRILPFLKAKGIASIDYWFVSHCDMDHISGLLEILEKGYKIKHIVLHEQCSSEENRNKIIKLAEEKGVKCIEMTAGDRIRSQQMEILCLAPLSRSHLISSQDENESSLVLQIECKYQKDKKSFKALFAGDISSEVENDLYEAGVWKDVDLFKAIHHGSNYSNSALLLEEISPEYIVVSCSKNNRYGHPGVHAVQRMKDCGAEIFCTMDGGQITFPLIQYSYENNRQ